MSSIIVFAEDTADPLRVTVGSAAAPLAEGTTLAMRLRDLSSGTVITSGTTTQSGIGVITAVRTWQSGEKIAGKRYLVEVIATLPSAAGTRTYPGADEDALVVEVISRRTA